MDDGLHVSKNVILYQSKLQIRLCLPSVVNEKKKFLQISNFHIINYWQRFLNAGFFDEWMMTNYSNSTFFKVRMFFGV